MPGSDLADLRVHRAGIDRALRHGSFRLRVVEIFLRVGGEFGLAAGRAEMKGFAAVVEPERAGRGINIHPADGIAHARVSSSVMAMMTMAGVIAASAALCRGLCIRIFGLDHRTLHHGPLATHTL